MNLIRSTLTVALSAAAIAILPGAASTQDTPSAVSVPGTVCGPRDDVVASLNAQYRETQQATGMLDPQTVLEVFISNAGSWTMVATGTDGNSCILFAGEDWDSKTMAIGVDA